MQASSKEIHQAPGRVAMVAIYFLGKFSHSLGCLLDRNRLQMVVHFSIRPAVAPRIHYFPSSTTLAVLGNLSRRDIPIDHRWKSLMPQLS